LATRWGFAMAKSSATRQPIECAMSVAPEEEILAWAKMPARSAAKEEMERGERAEVGERPCPSRSKRWRECDWVRALGRVEMRGVKYSEEAPRP
jgi:hypothetical protein